MKTESCGTPNPLQREGKSQKQRFTTGLNPDYVKVDERSTADLLVWASQFAKQLRYYNLEDKPDGNWSDFVNGDISVRLALIAVTDTQQLRDDYADLVEVVRDIVENRPSSDVQFLAKIRDALPLVFGNLRQQVEKVDGWLKQVSTHPTFSKNVRNIIKSRLRRHFKNLVEYAKGGVIFPDTDPILLANPVTEGLVGLSTDWFEQPEGQTLSLDQWLQDQFTPPNVQAYGNGEVADMTNSILERLDFTFRGLYEGQFLIVSLAAEHLEDTLGEWPDHKPHMALLITFLLLFKHAQDHINTFTERHLDFYYKEVLRLTEAPAVPDEVHVIFTLAKNVYAHLVESGTLLTAGKDKTGKELLYALADDTIFNTGQVDTLSTIFLDGDDNQRIYKAPVANSGDGIGGDFPADSTNSWRPFGASQKGANDGETTMIAAEVGFAVASPILALAEGTRIVTFTITLEANSYDAFVAARTAARQKLSVDDRTTFDGQSDFNLEFTLKKTWYAVRASELTMATNDTDKQIILTANLSESVPAVMPYVEKSHAAGFNASYPVARFIMNNDKVAYPYVYLKGLLFERIDIGVSVTGVRNVVVQSDLAVLAVDKAFQPFGPRPAPGSNFYIGSQEVFAKKLSSFKLNIQWSKQPASFEKHYTLYQGTFDPGTLSATLSLLDRRNWKALYGQGGVATVALFYEPPQNVQNTGNGNFGNSGPGNTNNALQDPTITTIRNPNTGVTTIDVTQIKTSFGRHVICPDPDLEPFTAWTPSLSQGFVRLTLRERDFGHDQFARIYARQAILLARGATTTNQAEINLAISQGLPPASPGVYPVPFPNDPYTPEINGFSLDYVSSVSMDFTGKGRVGACGEQVEELYHIHPFGFEAIEYETYDAGLLEETETTASGARIHVLPQFEGEGQLYIGISGMDLDESSSMSLLFQVMESTANPDVDKPEITWSYRADGKWAKFGTENTGTDGTNGLVTSGILKFGLPTDASTEHSQLKTGLHWIRGTVTRTKERPNTSVVSGVADVLTVTSQAAKAVFSNAGNDPNHLAQALPAESIAKLKIKEAEVKGVAQPYASFNGRMVEADESFYTRVSERLRHKDRSITIWDYETMVLERFPSVYRAKCLNHTSASSQIAPGNVYLVVVSNLVNKNAVDPLKPRISVNTLEEIHSFLRQKITPFVSLIVENPSYEEIRVEFNVSFTSDITDTGFYKKKLNEDILRFLTPWAYDAGADISFEGRLHSSVILDFVEELSYVDYLTDFKMYHIADPSKAEEAVEVDEAIASTPMSILVSAKEHTITPITKS